MGSAKREVVDITDIIKDNCCFFTEGNNDFKITQENILNYLSEKGCVEMEVIFQRNSDNKYFRGSYIKWPTEREFDNSQLVQVTKKIKVIDYFIY